MKNAIAVLTSGIAVSFAAYTEMNSAKNKIASTVLLMNLSCACTVPIVNWEYSVLSPDGKYVARSRVLGFKPHRYEFSIRSGGREVFRWTRDYGELHIGFCEVAWNPGSNRVAFYANDIYNGPDIQFGYSLSDQKVLTADSVKPELAASIVRRYQLGEEAGTPSFDVFQWSKTSHAQDLFENQRSTVRRAR